MKGWKTGFVNHPILPLESKGLARPHLDAKHTTIKPKLHQPVFTCLRLRRKHLCGLATNAQVASPPACGRRSRRRKLLPRLSWWGD